jgi:hypothetical protein
MVTISPDLVDDSQFWRDQKRAMFAAVGQMFRALFIAGAEAGAEETPVRTKQIAFDIDAINSAADDLIAEYMDEWWALLERATRDALREAIAEAREFGLGAEWVAEQIEPHFGADRATRIAVSEVTNLLGKGAQETYRQAGFTGWIWRTVNDSVVDILCTDLQRASDPSRGGKPFPMSRQFERAHPNCRCWPVPAGDVVQMPAAA